MRNNKKVELVVEEIGKLYAWDVCSDTFTLSGNALYSRKHDAKRGSMRAMRRLASEWANMTLNKIMAVLENE